MNWLVRKCGQGVWDPFQDVCEWPSDGGSLVESGWIVPLDVYETEDRVVVKAELPGLTSEDIHVDVEDRTLTIKAERKHEAESQDKSFYRKELAYGVFQRQVALPSTVNTDAIRASYKNGILEMSIPKREESKPKQITVKVD